MSDVKPCSKCGAPVEEARECYAIPTCYKCLPPPEKLGVIPPGTTCGYTTTPGRWCNAERGHAGEHNADGPPYREKPMADDRERLERIKAACEKATPGPWEAVQNYGEFPVRINTLTYISPPNSGQVLATSAESKIPSGVLIHPGIIHIDDAEFIALARTEMPWLLGRDAEHEKRLNLYRAEGTEAAIMALRLEVEIAARVLVEKNWRSVSEQLIQVEQERDAARKMAVRVAHEVVEAYEDPGMDGPPPSETVYAILAEPWAK